MNQINDEALEAKVTVDKVVDELKRVIVGKDIILHKVLMAILAGGHILLEDVPGVGKTTLALALSRVMNLDYKRVQFTPDTMASDIVGFSVYNKDKCELEYKSGAVFCNLFLADEINRTSAKTQSALLEVMEEGNVTVDGVSRRIPEPFICIATQNPMGSAGTQKLPDSQLDRFMIRLTMGYPDTDSQIQIVKQRQVSDPMNNVERLIDTNTILALRNAVRMVRMEDDVIRYATLLCEKTRSSEEIGQGAGPRAVIALTQLARAAALMDGRDYVIPKDIKELFVDVCAHRISLTARARIQKTTEKDILNKILQEVKPPEISVRKGK